MSLSQHFHDSPPVILSTVYLDGLPSEFSQSGLHLLRRVRLQSVQWLQFTVLIDNLSFLSLILNGNIFTD